MTQSQSGVQVNNLQTVSTLSNTASILALTDAVNNTVNLITKPNLAQSLVSSTSNNLLTSDTNGLIVNNIIGLLADLDTDTKTNIVSAINELVQSIDSINNSPITTLPTSGAISLEDNSKNTATPTAAISFTLPTITDNTTFHQILVQVNLTNTSYLSGDNLGTTYFFNQKKPTFVNSGRYDIIYEYDSTNSTWAVGAIYKGVVS